MDETLERFRAAADRCERTVFWHPRRSPAEVLAGLAEAAAGLDLDWDRYGAGGAVARLEDELTDLLGTEGAMVFPSGVMAQQCALRVWADRAGSPRVALPDLSHLVVQELDGPRLLHGLELEYLTTGPEVATAGSVAAIPGRLGAVLVELPLRDAGCLLPTWDELTGLSAAVRDRGVALHLDGARIWEAQPFWGRPHADIAGLADSTYVSFYKGLGGIAGAALAGPRDFLDEAGRWRKRMGGTLFHHTAVAVSALVGLREMLPRMAECLDWARELARGLAAAGFAVTPDPPHTATFQVYAGRPAGEVNERLLDHMARERWQLTGPWHAVDEPGRSRTELMCSLAALEHDPAWVTDRMADVVLGC